MKARPDKIANGPIVSGPTANHGVVGGFEDGSAPQPDIDRLVANQSTMTAESIHEGK